jgi:hypothetical protein
MARFVSISAPGLFPKETGSLRPHEGIFVNYKTGRIAVVLYRR